MEMNGVVKGMLIALVALYVISPLDLAPGPIDDLLLILFSAASSRRKNAVSGELPSESRDADLQD